MDVFEVKEIPVSVDRPHLKLEAVQSLDERTVVVFLVSPESIDTDFLVFCQRTCHSNEIYIHKLRWICGKSIFAMDLSPTIDWLTLITKTGRINILPVGHVLGMSQPACKFWNRTDITVLCHKLPDGLVQCVRWWRAFSGQNFAIVGLKNGRVVIADLSDGKTMVHVEVSGCVISCELVPTNDNTSTYCLLTSESGNQWKLNLEERHEKRQQCDTDTMGFQVVDVGELPAVDITQRSMIRKSSAELRLDGIFEPLKLFQFPQSVHLQYQTYEGKHFVSAYDRNTGRFQLFDARCLDMPVFVFGLPRAVHQVVVTERLLYVLYRPEGRGLALLLICRQHAHLSPSANAQHHTQPIPTAELKRSILCEFNIPLETAEDGCVGLYRFPRLSPFAVAGILQSKWKLATFAVFSGLVIATKRRLFICHQIACVEDIFMEHLLSVRSTEAEWLGVGLRLDMNSLYETAAEYLCSYPNADMPGSGQKAREPWTLAEEFFDMARTPMDHRLKCLCQHLPPEECLRFTLHQLRRPEDLTPAERKLLSDAALPMFAMVLVTATGSQFRDFVYRDKFRLFVMNNYHFDEVKAVHTFIQFGLVPEAFFIARERGSVVEAFQHLRDMNWTTGYHSVYPTAELREKYTRADRDDLMACISVMDLEILVRSEPNLLASLAQELASNRTELSMDSVLRACAFLDPSEGRPVHILLDLESCEVQDQGRDTDALAQLLSSTESLVASVRGGGRCRHELGCILNAFILLLIEAANRQRPDPHSSSSFIEIYRHIKERRRHSSGSHTEAEGSPYDDSKNPFYIPQRSPTPPIDEQEEDSESVSPPKSGTPCRRVLDLNRHVAVACPEGQLNIMGLEAHIFVPSGFDLGRMSVTSVSVGMNHALLLTAEGEVFSCGSNSHGQLGCGPSRMSKESATPSGTKILEPMRVPLPGSAVCIAAGGYHSGALVRSPDNADLLRTFTWGWGVHGQLGTGTVDDVTAPVQVLANEELAHMEMAIYHTLVVTKDGRLLAFGGNQFGQLGLCGIMKSSDPIQVSTLPAPVRLVASKFYHVCCVCENEEVYTWGIHPNLWTGDNESLSHDDAATPKLVDKTLLRTQRIQQVACGSTHTALLTNAGKVYCFGKNGCGQLGQGNRKDICDLIAVPTNDVVDYVAADDGVTLAVESKGSITVWGRMGHPMVSNVLGTPQSDVVSPTFLAELLTSHSRSIFNREDSLDLVAEKKNVQKADLLEYYFAIGRFVLKESLVKELVEMDEFAVMADLLLIEDKFLQSLHWRLKDAESRIEEMNNEDIQDFGTLVQFYLGLIVKSKLDILSASVYLILSFYERHNLPMTDLADTLSEYLDDIANPLVKIIHKRQQLPAFPGDFLVRLLDRYLSLTAGLQLNDRALPLPRQTRPPPPLHLCPDDLHSAEDLAPDSLVYGACEEPPTAAFVCGHKMTLRRLRDRALPDLADRLRRAGLALSAQFVNKVYMADVVFPACPTCLVGKLPV